MFRRKLAPQCFISEDSQRQQAQIRKDQLLKNPNLLKLLSLNQFSTIYVKLINFGPISIIYLTKFLHLNSKKEQLIERPFYQLILSFLMH